MNLTQSIDQSMSLVKVAKTDTGSAPITSADVNTWAKTSGVDFADMIAECIDLAETEFNFSIIGKTIVATFDGAGRNVARLPYGPVIAVSSVTSDGTAVSSDNYKVRGNEIVFDFRYTTAIVVTYTTGFGTVPSGINLGLKKMVLSNYEDRQDNVLGGISHFPSHSRKLLMQYRNY